MCFGLGLGCCLCFIESLPYLCLVTVPLLGSFYGVDAIYRISILLLIHGIIIECIPTVLFRVIPLLNLALFMVLMYLPISLTPWPVIWMYDKAIWFSNPVLMIAEVVLLQNYLMRHSQSFADEIEENEDTSFKYKAAILLFSSFCYAVAASLIYDMYKYTATGTQVLSLFAVIFILIAVHNMMWMAHEGIISDCAFSSLISIAVLYVMVVETQQLNNPLAEPHLWNSASSQSSFVNIMYSILNLHSANAQRSILYLKRFFSPLFLGLLAIRLYSILFIANKVTRNFFTEKDSDEDMETAVRNFDEGEKTPWRSPILLKASIIFMLTQFSSHFLAEWSGNVTSFPWLTRHFMKIWPSEILLGRLAQIFSVNIFYMWRLYRADNWTWNPWLTP